MFHLIFTTTMINSIIDALQYPFFIRSLLVIILLSIIFPLYWNIVLLRKEANIAHTFANMWLLWISIWLWFNWSIEWSILWSIILTIILISILSFKNKNSFDAINEILAQLGIVSAILIVSQMTWYRADINSYLFWDILLIKRVDILILVIITLVSLWTYYISNKRRYADSINTEIALSKNYPLRISSVLYLVILWIIIGSAMKIVWVLLVSAFLILPSNIAKVFSNNKKQRIILWITISTFTSILAIFLSRHFNFPTWATIVGLLIITYLITQFKLQKK